MRTTPEIQEKLKARLTEAIKKAGSADALGRMLGWTNGGPVRNCLNEKKPRNVTPEFILKANESKEAWLHGWFDAVLPPISKADILTLESARATKKAWPFERLTPEQWEALKPSQRAVVEDAAIVKYRELTEPRPTTSHAKVKANTRKLA